MRAWWGYFAALTILAVAIGADASSDRREHREYAQAGYDLGVRIGRILGNCEGLKEVAKANPDSKWTADFNTDTRAACDAALSEHAPGTKETLKVGQ